VGRQAPASSSKLREAAASLLRLARGAENAAEYSPLELHFRRGYTRKVAVALSWPHAAHWMMLLLPALLAGSCVAPGGFSNADDSPGGTDRGSFSSAAAIGAAAAAGFAALRLSCGAVSGGGTPAWGGAEGSSQVRAHTDLFGAPSWITTPTSSGTRSGGYNRTEHIPAKARYIDPFPKRFLAVRARVLKAVRYARARACALAPQCRHRHQPPNGLGMHGPHGPWHM